MCVVSCSPGVTAGWLAVCWLLCARACVCVCVRAHCLLAPLSSDPLHLLQLRHSVRKYRRPHSTSLSVPRPLPASHSFLSRPQALPSPWLGPPSGFLPSTFSSCRRGRCGRWSLAIATLSLTQAGAPSLALMWPAHPHSQTAIRGVSGGHSWPCAHAQGD